MRPARMTSPDDLSTILGVGAVIGAAARHGVLDAIARGTATTRAELTLRLALHDGAVTRLVDALTALGVVIENEGGLTLSDATREAISREPAPLATTAKMWAFLDEHLHTGADLGLMGESGPSRDETYVRVVDGLATRFEEHAVRLAALLDRPLSRVLDLGVGSGVWSLAMVAKGGGSVVGIDGAATSERFLARAKSLGLSLRVEARVGDYLTIPLEDGAYDRVVLANVVHLEPSETARALVGRAARALAKGGELVVIDALPKEGPRERADLALYALGLSMRVPHGRVYTHAEIEEFVVDAGLRSVRTHHLDSSHGGALVAVHA
jgi:SAM-dependent methyltransferase